MQNKKASLELSANAIVILIIAIVILGLGLAFVRDLFGDLTGKIGEAGASVDIGEPATAKRPIVFPKTVTLERGSDIKNKLSYYNNKNCGAGVVNEVQPIISSCYNAEAGDWDDIFGSERPTMSSKPKVVACGETVEFLTIIQGPGNMPGGQSICTISIGPPAGLTQTEIFLEVPS